MERKFRLVRIVGLCFLAGVGIALGSAAVQGQAKAKPGESTVTFDYPQMKDVGPVEFSHLAHKKAFGQEKLDCKPCHFQPPPLFPMKPPSKEAPAVTMKQMEEGKSCGKCHDGKTEINGKVAFSVAKKEDCAKCHKKK